MEINCHITRQATLTRYRFACYINGLLEGSGKRIPQVLKANATDGSQACTKTLNNDAHAY